MGMSVCAGAIRCLAPRECEQIGVTPMADTEVEIIEPPADSEYPVEPKGVQTTKPSPKTVPYEEPPIIISKLAIEPKRLLYMMKSFVHSVFVPSCIVHVSIILCSTVCASFCILFIACPSSSIPHSLRKPILPMLTPRTGTPCCFAYFFDRSIVPSPPSATTISALSSHLSSTKKEKHSIPIDSIIADARAICSLARWFVLIEHKPIFLMFINASV